MHFFLAYVISLVGGWLITGSALWIMYWSIGKRRNVFRWMHFWVGTTERAIATTLVILAPSMLAGFIAGWIVLKLAANWQRKVGEEYTDGHLLALVGNAVSFTVAIAGGIVANPCALTIWAK